MIYQLKYAAFFISYPLIINFIFNCETSVSYSRLRRTWESQDFHYINNPK